RHYAPVQKRASQPPEQQGRRPRPDNPDYREHIGAVHPNHRTAADGFGTDGGCLLTSGSTAGPPGDAWDHFGTTRYALDQTMCTSAQPTPDRHSPTVQSKRLNPCPGE